MRQIGAGKGRRSAFTLIELLVVVAVIAVLAGIITPTLILARRHATRKMVENEITELKVAAGSYFSDFGDYPPSQLSDLPGLSKEKSNKINEGIECLIAALATRSKNGPYFEPKEERLQNYDGDAVGDKAALTQLNWYFGTAHLFEYVDPWGNPYIYIHNRDYPSAASYRNAQGVFKVQAAKSKKTAVFHDLYGFQIWSCGPNGKNEGGEGDDVTSWK